MNTTNVSTSSVTKTRRVFVQRSPGVELCILRVHPDGGLTLLVRMQKGARAERHGHPGGEETYVITGRLRIDRRLDAARQPRPDVILCAGDHAFVEAGEIHEGFAEEETTFFVVAPGGLVDQPSES